MIRLLLVSMLLVPLSVLAQQGGSTTYSFLELESSSRIAGSGGTILAVKDGDPNTAFINPSLLDSSMHGKIALNYINYFAGINYGYAGYVHDFGKVTGAANLMYLNYGKFKRTDEYGNHLGEFVANDLVFNVGASHHIDTMYSIGANFKIINSVLESYSSFGVAIDLSGTYYRKSTGFAVTALIRNAGIQLKSYNKGVREPLPLRIDVALSKKAAKAPFRLNFLFRDLQRWDLTYMDPNAEPEIDPLTQEPIPITEPGFLEKLMRHIGAGVQFVPNGDALFFDLGYNYRRRQELKLDNRPGMVGFSFGGGIKIKRFRFSYGRAIYHRAGGSNHITVTTNLRG